MTKRVATLFGGAAVLAGSIAFAIYYASAPTPGDGAVVLYAGSHFDSGENCELVGLTPGGEATCEGWVYRINLQLSDPLFSYVFVADQVLPRACMNGDIEKTSKLTSLPEDPIPAIACFSERPK